MRFEQKTETTTENRRGTYAWLDRYWPPSDRNPFAALVDPEYPIKVLKERTTLSRATPRSHTLADAPEADESSFSAGFNSISAAEDPGVPVESDQLP